MERRQERQICSPTVTSFVQGCKMHKRWQIDTYFQNITCKVENKRASWAKPRVPRRHLPDRKGQAGLGSSPHRNPLPTTLRGTSATPATRQRQRCHRWKRTWASANRTRQKHISWEIHAIFLIQSYHHISFILAPGFPVCKMRKMNISPWQVSRVKEPSAML